MGDGEWGGWGMGVRGGGVGDGGCGGGGGMGVAGGGGECFLANLKESLEDF